MNKLIIAINNMHLVSVAEILILIGILAVALIVSRMLMTLIKGVAKRTIFIHFLRVTSALILPIILISFLFVGLVILHFMVIRPILIVSLIKIAIAWAAIVLVKFLTTRRHTGWFVAVVIVPITVLNLFEMWDPCVTYLESITFSLAKTQISIYQALKTVFIVIVLFRLTKFIIQTIETRLRRLHRIKSSNKVLILKLVQVITYFVILLVALDLLGINITTLAVFSGAIGVGLGFGLQKITSNFISGIIILLEKSIEIDDLVELSDGTNGIVKRTGGRYILIETLQGKEVLVPNEDFITQRVINWTYTTHKCRIEVPISISYKTDLEFARKIILESALSCSSIAKSPEPTCYLTEFGAGSINFALFFWIDDIIKGRYEPQSEVMFAIWKNFKHHGIEIPYSQVDVHLKSEES